MESVGILLYLFFFTIFFLTASLKKNGALGILSGIVLFLLGLNMLFTGVLVETGYTTEILTENTTKIDLIYGTPAGSGDILTQGLNYYNGLGFIICLISIYLMYIFVINLED